jgi:hypothetical protein
VHPSNGPDSPLSSFTPPMKNWDETNAGLKDLYDHENGRGHDKVTH